MRLSALLDVELDLGMLGREPLDELLQRRSTIADEQRHEVARLAEQPLDDLRGDLLD